jgi:hypothetical protein
LETTKADGTYWDLSKEEDVEELKFLQEAEDPMMLVGSPPCTAFSNLLKMKRHSVHPGKYEQLRESGRLHLRNSVASYLRQIGRGRYFLHEAPSSADSFDEPEVIELLKMPGILRVRGPMCRWDMMATDGAGTSYVRKSTDWVTNSPVLAAILEGECSNKFGWHRHVHLLNGRARHAQVYPPRLVRAILLGIKRQMLVDGELSELEAALAGPVCEEENLDINEPNTR